MGDSGRITVSDCLGKARRKGGPGGGRKEGKGEGRKARGREWKGGSSGAVERVEGQGGKAGGGG